MQEEPRPAAPKIALVIGSGAVQCAAALGLWKVLHRNGIQLDQVVGCSGGSLYAATLALGYDQAASEEMTTTLWTREVTEQRDVRSLLGAFLPRIFGFDGHLRMVDDRALNRALETVFRDLRFADTKIPLRIVATDLMDGAKVVLSEGRLFDAIRASIAIPYVWKPWMVDGRALLDGCMCDPLPIDVAMREGADLILAMGFETPYPRRLKSATRFAFQINSIYTNNLLRANFAFHNAAHHAEIIPIMPEFGRPIRLFDTDQFGYVIEQGERATEAQLPYLQRLLAGSAV